MFGISRGSAKVGGTSKHPTNNINIDHFHLLQVDISIVSYPSVNSTTPPQNSFKQFGRDSFKKSESTPKVFPIQMGFVDLDVSCSAAVGSFEKLPANVSDR